MSNPNLNDIQFSVYTGGAEKVGQGAVYAHQGSTLYEHEGKAYRNTDNVIGKLQWGMEHAYGNPSDPDRGGPHEVDEVWVHPDYRRAGIATAMLGVAKGVATDIRPSPHRTDAGEAWGLAQGAAPREKKAPWNDRSGMYPA